MRAGLISLLFPPKCTSCGALLRFKGLGAELSALCTECEKVWRSEKLSSCGWCGKPVSVCSCMPEELQRARCTELRKLVYYLGGTRFSVQNRMLYRLKKAPDRRGTAFLAEELTVAVREWEQNGLLPRAHAAVMYLPRGTRAVLETGTDQAKQLARALAERVQLPMIQPVVRRWGRGQQQKQLGPRERRRNAGRSYRIRRGTDLHGMTVILVDDIVTTGSSMAAAAKLLFRAGAERILCLAAASDSDNQSPDIRQPAFRIDRKPAGKQKKP